jgi:hypothetical protein
MSSMNILLTEENDDLPIFCWMSKLHKNAYRERINAGNYVCEINELNRTMTNMFSAITKRRFGPIKLV